MTDLDRLESKALAVCMAFLERQAVKNRKRREEAETMVRLKREAEEMNCLTEEEEAKARLASKIGNWGRFGGTRGIFFGGKDRKKEDERMVANFAAKMEVSSKKGESD